MLVQRRMFLGLATNQVGAIRNKEDQDKRGDDQRPVNVFQRRVKVHDVTRDFVLEVADRALLVLLAQPSAETLVVDKGDVALAHARIDQFLIGLGVVTNPAVCVFVALTAKGTKIRFA